VARPRKTFRKLAGSHRVRLLRETDDRAAGPMKLGFPLFALSED
jgi:hypothetical protein